MIRTHDDKRRMIHWTLVVHKLVQVWLSHQMKIITFRFHRTTILGQKRFLSENTITDRLLIMAPISLPRSDDGRSLFFISKTRHLYCGRVMLYLSSGEIHFRPTSQKFEITNLPSASSSARTSCVTSVSKTSPQPPNSVRPDCQIIK